MEALCAKLATITGREDWSVTDEEIRGKKADDCFYRVGAGAYMGSADSVLGPIWAVLIQGYDSVLQAHMKAKSIASVWIRNLLLEG